MTYEKYANTEIEIDGKVYVGLTAVSAHFRIPTAKLYSRYIRGVRGKNLIKRFACKVRNIVEGEEYFGFEKMGEDYGINPNTLTTRYHKGVRGDALIAPVTKRRIQVEYKGKQYRSFFALCKAHGVSQSTAYQRYEIERIKDKDVNWDFVLYGKKGLLNG